MSWSGVGSIAPQCRSRQWESLPDLACKQHRVRPFRYASEVLPANALGQVFALEFGLNYIFSFMAGLDFPVAHGLADPLAVEYASSTGASGSVKE